MWGTLDNREREARKMVLHLISEGRVPGADSLAASLGCSRGDAAARLDGLVAKGYVVRDGEGDIAAAYPLSVRPTRHRVTLGRSKPVYALCAVDALGVSAVFGVSAAIEARCPHCERLICLAVANGEVVRREPASTVLWYTMADLLEKRIEGLNLSALH